MTATKTAAGSPAAVLMTASTRLDRIAYATYRGQSYSQTKARLDKVADTLTGWPDLADRVRNAVGRQGLSLGNRYELVRAAKHAVDVARLGIDNATHVPIDELRSGDVVIEGTEGFAHAKRPLHFTVDRIVYDGGGRARGDHVTVHGSLRIRGDLARIYTVFGFVGQPVAVVAPYVCRDCGVAAARDDDGVFHGIIDVDPCPAGPDDFHHFDEVVR